MKELEIGKTYDFLMKPTIMRGWKIMRKTPNCFAVVKDKKGSKMDIKKINYTLIPKKLVIDVREIK